MFAFVEERAKKMDEEVKFESSTYHVVDDSCGAPPGMWRITCYPVVNGKIRKDEPVYMADFPQKRLRKEYPSDKWYGRLPDRLQKLAEEYYIHF